MRQYLLPQWSRFYLPKYPVWIDGGPLEGEYPAKWLMLALVVPWHVGEKCIIYCQSSRPFNWSLIHGWRKCDGDREAMVM